MDIRRTVRSSLVKLLAASCLLALLGCGVIVTQQAAQNAVDDAKSAIGIAKDADADIHSAGNMKRAEKLMSEAEVALSRKRRQRAYRLATQAEKAANEALAEAEQNLKKAEALDETQVIFGDEVVQEALQE